ncbi:thiamine-phosphate kinase [Paraglaciecola hydrolytica]|uniref:Thiamine-monophosphate kinase n=1 Tax=Paraglaciecola hydrolytica TaxID=1799789 RepID=A0A136A2D1_9ALTE|nr:thiamine-phosphate kinase [Paraglaciecola hydrolytica]KXI29381.1 thiamine-monophosphate kinase [Paraglaciecola hydrolytica]
MKEFSIIDTFFKQQNHQRKDVLLGIGDDAALTVVPAGQALVTTTDTLLAGVHFLPDAEPSTIARKAVAVNLSDLAAMGAEPAWISLSISLPTADEAWLSAFATGLAEMTRFYSIQLIGGDTVQGPLAVTITAQGFVPPEQALLRSKAKPGDFIYVTGTLGDAGLGLDLLLNKVTVADPINAQYVLNRLHNPTPRLLVGTSLRRIANACIDLSDGLSSDIKHILQASNCGATINVDKLPLSKAMRESVEPQNAVKYALSAGDDYELLFTVSEEQKGKLETAMANTSVSFSCIGQLNGMSNKLEYRLNNQVIDYQATGYQHF